MNLKVLPDTLKEPRVYMYVSGAAPDNAFSVWGSTEN